MEQNLETSITPTLIRHGKVAAAIRDRIVRGPLQPGSRLPTRRQLTHEFGTTLQTVQMAFDRLNREGFIFSRGSKGTYVADRPPHLCRYGLVFPFRPAEQTHHWPWFWSALRNEAERVEAEGREQVPSFYGDEKDVPGTDFQELARDARQHCLAGLIFAHAPTTPALSWLAEQADLPCVAIAHLPLDAPMARVVLDIRSFVDQALDHLLAQGRRRVAILTTGDWLEVAGTTLQSALAARDMSIPARWIQGVDRRHARLASNAAHLLMHGEADHRPDGLIIVDDNLVEHAAAGLVAAGVRVPDDLEVVAHCNFPWPVPSALPVKRLGFNARQVMESCLACIDTQRDGAAWDQVVRIPAVFEEQLTHPAATPQPRDVMSARGYATAF